MDLRVDGPPVPVPPALELCAYRIVQEALTNAIKHAAPAHASVAVRWREGALELEISDDGRRARSLKHAAGATGSPVCGSVSRCTAGASRPVHGRAVGSPFARVSR